MYNHSLLKSKKFDIPIICVGNLSTGGTGKTPMIEFLSEFLKQDYKIAVLSRGYKRKTKGFLKVSLNSSAEEVGDEPLQIKLKFPEITVAVCENRVQGIEILKNKNELILLDDAFQHRRVNSSYSILLTSFDNLYIDDFILPTGNLREPKRGIRRADMVVVTKCPPRVSYAKLQEIQFRLNLSPQQKLYFSSIVYDENIYGKKEKLPLEYLRDKPFTLVTGIANPRSLLEFLKNNDYSFEHLEFPDHHNFSTADLSILNTKEIILTTEKDYRRLATTLNKHALYYLPITTIILKEQEKFLKQTILAQIEQKRRG